MPQFDRSKSLQELEGVDWGEPNYESHVVIDAHRLHRVPLCEFTVDDLRFMIGQDNGLQYLIPIALEHLAADPFVAGDCYEGDLLAAVLRANSRFWIATPELREGAERIAQQALSLLPSLDECDRPTAQKSFTDAYDIFQRAEYFAKHGRA
ncbi:MAG: hypothetical protein H0X66_18235 [Verrucomicrobia bacterium]|nr:hypothetical protein [Verrucomicrobiota bacterium]